jgi:pimeloyl-ACP methyl ester carboxylesterase
MSFIRSKDATLYLEEYGSGEPLVLLPGLLGTIESHWRRFIPALARYFHVIAVDVRGHGRTNNPGGVLRLHTLVGDLYALYEALELEAASICGYSLGGYIGLAFGIQHPGRVRALMMHATKFYWTPDAVAATVGDLDPERIRAHAPHRAAQLQADHAFNGENGWEALMVSAREFVTTLPHEGLSEQSLSLARFPVCVSLGDRDEMIARDEAERIASLLPDARLDILPETRHAIQRLQTSLFIEHALAFFQRKD